MVIDLSNGFHFRPAKDSLTEILFAYPDKDETPSFSTDFEESFIAKVYEKAKHRAPFLCETEVVREKCRAGLYENTPDHHAILGGCQIEGLYFANGFSGHGVMHSPATGRALSEIILDGKASFLDVSCLNLARFANGELLTKQLLSRCQMSFRYLTSSISYLLIMKTALIHHPIYQTRHGLGHPETPSVMKS